MYLVYPLTLLTCLYLGNGIVFAQSEPPLNTTPASALDRYKTDDIKSEFENLFVSLKQKAPNEIFEEGNKALKRQEYKVAIQTYQVLASLYPLSEYTEKARLSTIQAYYDQQDIDHVIHAVNQFISLYPKSQYLEKVHYLRATVYLRPQDNMVSLLYRVFKSQKLDPAHCIDVHEVDQAIQLLSEFLERFPTGQYSGEASEKLEDINRLVARHEYYIADFYFKSQNYVAAYNRISNLLERYPEIEKVLPENCVSSLNKHYLSTKQKLGLITD